MRSAAIGMALAAALAAPVFAQDMVAKNVRVVVAAANPKDARVVGTISNPGMYSTYLVSATSDAAERVELRDARKKDAKVAEVEIPAFGALSLDAKAIYLALVNPKKPLARGTRVDLMLSNEANVKTKITAVVGP